MGGEEEDEYIEMEVGPGQPSPEFEFRPMRRVAGDADISSPADELFYKGKLLPLHLPPRLQMVQLLLQESLSSNVHVSNVHVSIEMGPTRPASPARREPKPNNTLKSAIKACLKSLLNWPGKITALPSNVAWSRHRRSFSGVLRRGPSFNYSSSSSSSSSSLSSSCSSLKRSSSGGSASECPIQGAIAYCKKSAGLRGFGSVAVERI